MEWAAPVNGQSLAMLCRLPSQRTRSRALCRLAATPRTSCSGARACGRPIAQADAVLEAIGWSPSPIRSPVIDEGIEAGGFAALRNQRDGALPQ